MYHYVKDDDFLKLAYSTVSQYMNILIQFLREEETIARVFHIGIGATRNMVNQNDDGPINFDFSILITDSRIVYRECKYIKNQVRTTLAEVLNIKDVNEIIDSRYELSTGILHLDEYPNIGFKINLCIIRNYRRNKNYYQLVHNECSEYDDNEYMWEEVFDSDDLPRQVSIIKENKLWKVLKEWYLRYKNSTPENSFFACYKNAVNQVRTDYDLDTLDRIMMNDEDIIEC